MHIYSPYSNILKINYFMKKNLIKVAICYDFDGTLAPGNMQEYGFMNALGTTPDEFWGKSDKLADETKADKNLCYMLTMLREAKAKKIPFRKEDLARFGKNIPLFEGVKGYFNRINAYAREHGIELQHFLLSSGLKEIVSGLPINKEFTKVYACSFMYDENGEAFWPAQVVNYTTKTQYIFRINKGCLDESDMSVNDRKPDELRDIPFSRIMYIGDGLTDVPCMSMLRQSGGTALAVYTLKGSKHALKLLNDSRVDNIAVADYSENSTLDLLIKSWLRKIKAEQDFKNL